MNKPRLEVNRGNIGNEIYIHLPDLDSFEKTFLSADEDSGQTTLSVISGKNFDGDYVLIGIPGTEKCELVALSGQTDTTVTVGATSFDHPKGTLVTMMPFNQIEIYSATAVGGTYSLIATVDITPDSLFTEYVAASDPSTQAYKVRFKNQNDTTYSDYSEETTGSGYDDNTVYSIKKRALDQMGEKIEGSLTNEFLNEALGQARREVDSLRKRWSFRTSFGSVLGVISTGQWRMAVPSDLRAPNSPDNILSIKIGAEGIPVKYLTKREFDAYYLGSAHTTLGSAISAGDTSLTGDSTTGTGDFEESGTVKIGGDDVTYTSNDEDTETLSGIPSSGTGSITASHAVGTDVWQGVEYGLPMYFTVHEGYIYFNSPFDSDYEDENVHIDYYKTLPAKTSDSDVLDEPEYDMYVHYLKAVIKQKKGKAEKDITKDGDYILFLQKAKVMAGKDRHNQYVGMQPDIDHLIYEE